MVYGTQNYWDCQQPAIKGLDKTQVFGLQLTALLLIATIAGLWGAF